MLDPETAQEALRSAISLAELAEMSEGPKGQLEAIGLAQVYALIAIAKSLETLASAVSETPNGFLLHVASQDPYR